MFVRFARSPRLALGLVAATILACGLLALPATAFNPQPDPPFGMVGIAQGQTARLNLVHTGSAVPGLIPPDPCRARLRFLDADGNVLTALTAEVPAGHSTFLDFTPASIPTNLADALAPLRAEVRASVRFLTDQTPPDPCRTNVEIFDNVTGRTTVLFPPDPCRGPACRAQQ
jgi:hypothetical protein